MPLPTKLDRLERFDKWHVLMGAGLLGQSFYGRRPMSWS